MAETYRFLRFELPSFSLFLYIVIFISPFIVTSELSSGKAIIILAGLGTSFVISLPLGYAIHQLAVNRYRSLKFDRPSHKILQNWANNIFPKNEAYNAWSEKDKFTFLDSLLAFSFGLSGVKNSEIVESKLNGRWSHFYARSAIGKWSLYFGALFTIFALIGNQTFLKMPVIIIDCPRIALGISFFVIFLILSIVIINKYLNKLWGEICMIEGDYVIENETTIKDFIKSMIGKTTNYTEVFKKEFSIFV